MRVAIIIAGAGPAGCAAALTLRGDLPELRVALLTEPPPPGPAVGEALSPGIRPLLHYLGIQEDFQTTPHMPAGSTASVWGSSSVLERNYLFSGGGHGWLLDRLRFNAWMIDQARKAGVMVIETSASAERTPEGWCLPGTTLVAATLIDATGRAARFARRYATAPERQDRLVADVAWYTHEAPKTSAAGILVEAVPDGWWYSATLPDHRAVAMFMTDAPLRKSADRTARLQIAPATAARLARWRPLDQTAVRPAWSQITPIVVGNGWVAAGDAAAAFDPLSSLGIGFSLRSGIEAARVAAADAEQDCSLRAAYQASIDRIYADYRRRLAAIYRQEHRWPDAPFWASRHCGYRMTGPRESPRSKA